MKRLALLFLLALLSFATAAKADRIAIGQLSYLGVSPNGSSVFNATLTPPTGISLMSLARQSLSGTISSPSACQQGKSSCLSLDQVLASQIVPVLTSMSIFIANHGTTVMFRGQTVTLKQRSHFFLRPVDGAKFLTPGQSGTIFLSAIPGKDEKEAALNIAAVPEPGAWVLVVSGIGMILGASLLKRPAERTKDSTLAPTTFDWIRSRPNISVAVGLDEIKRDSVTISFTTESLVKLDFMPVQPKGPR